MASPVRAERSTQPAGDIRLSVVLPVWSETASLSETVGQLSDLLGPALLHEIIVVISPYSTAESFAVCRDMAARFAFVRLHTQEHNPGLGWAFREGFERVTGTHVLMMNSDGETDPHAVPKMIDQLRSTGCDIVTANRWAPGGGFEGYDRLKWAMNFLFQKMIQVLHRTSVGDSTYAFRILPTALVQSIRWESTGHEFALESLLKPLRMGRTIREVPVRWRCRGAGESKNTLWRHSRYFDVAFRVLRQTPESFLRPAGPGVSALT